MNGLSMTTIWEVLNTGKSTVNSFQIYSEKYIPAIVQLFFNVIDRITGKSNKTCTIAVM